MNIYAQTVQIDGSVIDADTGSPLFGANVVVKGEMVGSATDANGKFSFKFEAAADFTIIVSYMGYKRVERLFSPGDDFSNLVFEMEEDIFMGETVVVTGIASKRSRARSEVAVARVNAAELTEEQSYDDLSTMIGAKVAGVQVKKSSGNVGGGIRFDMRSGVGLNGNGQPLIIVDGARISSGTTGGWDVGGQDMSLLADLNTDDIASIDILKGPAAASSFGIDGSNGVVIITTKRGKIKGGGIKAFGVNYKTVYGYNTQSYEYGKDEFASYKDCNAIFRDGMIRQNILSAFGSSGTMRYYVSFSNRGEEGILPQNRVDLSTMSANIDVFPNEKISLNASAKYSISETTRPNNDNNIYGFLGNTMLFPFSYAFTDSIAVNSLETSMTRNRFIGSVNFTYSPIKNLDLNGTIGIDSYDLRDDKMYPYGCYYSFPGDTGQRMLQDRVTRQVNGKYSAAYSYNPLKGLEVTSAVGSQFLERKNRSFNFQKGGFETELITDIAAAGEFRGGGETFAHFRQASIFTTHQFAYLDQYFVTLNYRKDYACTIGEEAPSIYYPNFTFAVRLDKYDFFPEVFDLFKLRGAYGESGQLPGALDAIPLLWTSERSGFGTGAVLSSIGNVDIKPERIKELEVGFDAEILGNYAIELTYYNQKAINGIIGFEKAPSTGLTASNVPFNVGEQKGWGLEALLRGRPINKKNFSLDFSLTHSYQDNEVVDLGGAQPMYSGFDVNVVKVGLPQYAFYVPEVFGALFDANGAYAGVDAGDREYAGTPVPPQLGAFSINMKVFRNLNIRVLCDWALGQSALNMTSLFQALMGNNQLRNDLKDELDALTPGTDEYTETAHEYAKTHGGYDWNFIQESDYFKLREISLSYDCSDLIPKVLGTNTISSLVVGVSGINLWTTTKYLGADPEINYGGSRGLDRANDFLTLMHPTTYNMWVRIGL